jgi:hypothetical protein
MKRLYPAVTNGSDTLTSRYLELLKRSLTHWPWLEDHERQCRMDGRDWPAQARGDSMIGALRMNSLHRNVLSVLDRQIRGDFVEAGVWRGGASIFLAGALRAFDQMDRSVWLLDSFAGLPPPRGEQFPADAGAEWHLYKELTVPLEDVRQRFRDYDLLSDNVRFVEGFYEETLQDIAIESVALLRIDCDMYGSTTTVLEALYDRISPGGIVAVDDYFSIEACGRAVDDFMKSRGIAFSIEQIDWAGGFFEKPA